MWLEHRPAAWQSRLLHLAKVSCHEKQSRLGRGQSLLSASAGSGVVLQRSSCLDTRTHQDLNTLLGRPRCAAQDLVSIVHSLVVMNFTPGRAWMTDFYMVLRKRLVSVTLATLCVLSVHCGMGARQLNQQVCRQRDMRPAGREISFKLWDHDVDCERTPHIHGGADKGVVGAEFTIMPTCHLYAGGHSQIIALTYIRQLHIACTTQWLRMPCHSPGFGSAHAFICLHMPATGI